MPSTRVDESAVPNDPANPNAAKIDTHALRNRLAGLVISLRALASDLEATASQPDKVLHTTDDYETRFEHILEQISAALTTSADAGSSNP